jgi:hypothetical protein
MSLLGVGSRLVDRMGVDRQLTCHRDQPGIRSGLGMSGMSPRLSEKGGVTIIGYRK